MQPAQQVLFSKPRHTTGGLDPCLEAKQHRKALAKLADDHSIPGLPFAHCPFAGLLLAGLLLAGLLFVGKLLAGYPLVCHDLADLLIAGDLLVVHQLAARLLAVHPFAASLPAAHRLAAHRLAAHRLAVHPFAASLPAAHRLAAHRLAAHRLADCPVATQLPCSLIETQTRGERFGAGSSLNRETKREEDERCLDRLSLALPAVYTAPSLWILNQSRSFQAHRAGSPLQGLRRSTRWLPSPRVSRHEKSSTLGLYQVAHDWMTQGDRWQRTGRDRHPSDVR